MKTLITSFGPFGVFQSNPSHDLMLMLKQDNDFTVRFGVEYDVLEVSYQAVDEWIASREADFDLIIHMGVASGATLLRLEIMARNAVEGEDVRGWKPSTAFIDATGEDLPTNFPEEDLKKIASRFRDVSILSEDAGSYLCNYLYYKSLKYLSSDSKVLFLHIADVQRMSDATDLMTQKAVIQDIVEHSYLLGK